MQLNRRRRLRHFLGITFYYRPLKVGFTAFILLAM
jgi:hypothetical protein